MKLNVPRKHHFVPRAFLASFTNTGCGKNGTLFVLDKDKNEIRESNVYQIANKNDLYTNWTKVDKDVKQEHVQLEYFLKHIEDLGIAEIYKIISLREMPPSDSQEFYHLATYLGFQSTRTLRSMAKLKENVENFDPIQAIEYVKNNAPDILERYRLLGIKSSLEDLINTLSSPGFKPKADQADFHRFIWLTSLRSARDMFERPWIIIENETDADFVSSDHPLSVVPTKNHTGKVIGYGNEEAIVSIALSPRVALYSHPRLSQFKGTEKKIKCENKELIAEINSCTTRSALRFVYLKTPNLVWYKAIEEGSTISDLEDFRSYLTRKLKHN